MSDLDNLLNLFNQPVNSIQRDNGKTVVEFKNGEKVQLDGIPTELNHSIPSCSFCGVPSINDMLFTTNDEAYICKTCINLAIQSFIQNGVDIDIPLFQSLKDTISKTQNFVIKTKNSE